MIFQAYREVFKNSMLQSGRFTGSFYVTNDGICALQTLLRYDSFPDAPGQAISRDRRAARYGR